MRNTTSGVRNTGLGTGAGGSNSSGSRNIFIGYAAGVLNSSGNGNVFIGNRAGRFETTGLSNIAIGDSAQCTSTAIKTIAIGYSAAAGADSSIAIGTGSSTSIPRTLVIENIDSALLKFATIGTATDYVLAKDASGYAKWKAVTIWDPTTFTQSDSVSIYTSTPTDFTTYGCTDCTGNGVTGAIVSYFGGAWRRLKFD